MADIVQVTGFILSSMPVGEYDRRIVILSKELGKISAFAKGARRPNSHLIGVTRPFIFGTFECYRGRDSYTIFKAEVKNYFEELVSDLDRVWILFCRDSRILWKRESGCRTDAESFICVF